MSSPAKTVSNRAGSLKTTGSLKVHLRTILLGSLTLAVALAIMAASQEAFARGRDRTAIRIQSRSCWVFAPTTNVSLPARAVLCAQIQGRGGPAGPQGLGGPPGPKGKGLRARGRAPSRAEGAVEAIDAIRLNKLAQALELNAEQRKLVANVFTKGLVRKRDLLRERAQILEKMRQLNLAAKPADIERTEPEMRDLVVNFRRVERQIAETEWTTRDEILAHLAPNQGVRCILFNEGFDRKLRMSLGPFWQRK